MTEIKNKSDSVSTSEANTTKNSATETSKTNQVLQAGQDIFKTATEAATTVGNLAEKRASEFYQLIEQTTHRTGTTLEAIAQNRLFRFADKIPGINWGVGWLKIAIGDVNIVETQARVDKIKSQYPQENASQIAHRLIVEKSLQAGRLGFLANFIPPIAAAMLGIELVGIAKLQAEMVYEIAAAYGLDIKEPARRGEVLAIYGLSFGGNFLKAGLNFIEIIPGVGAVVGASTNAALLYVIGQTSCRFYEGKNYFLSKRDWQQEAEKDWQTALAQSEIMDRILVHMVRASCRDCSWSEIVSIFKTVSLSSTKTVASELENPEPLDSLLNQLSPDFAPLVLQKCDEIARLDGTITPEEQEILDAIAQKFNLELPNQEKAL